MVPSVISHYEILEKLGEGGMGVVYKARDTKLDRFVALKFLPSAFTSTGEGIARLQQEARAASALNHPNILTIYDVEEVGAEHFIVMELVEGEPLKSIIDKLRAKEELLPVAQVLKYALDIASGLEKAHKKGIVHRDIKADNIMVTHDGLVKIMDFGLAKLRGQAGLTRTGSTVGTLAYMSPEQIQGIDADEQTDIYAFGVLVYQMLTGRLPFAGAHEAAIMYEILHVEPPRASSLRPDIDPEWDAFIGKCLDRDRGRRYRSMADMLVDLRQLSIPSASPGQSARSGSFAAPRPGLLQPGRRKLAVAGLAMIFLAIVVGGILYFSGRRNQSIDSIAVLPFRNASNDSTLDYLSDGITETLINSLSQISSLKVVPRGTAFLYKGKEGQAQKIGNDLNVRAVVTGRVALHDDNLNIQAELIDVRHQAQLWGEQYNRKMTDIFALQEEIASRIADRLRLRLSGEDKKKLTKRYTENAEAYQLYLKANYFINKATQEELAKGLELSHQAIALDPGFALAYVSIAFYYAVLTDFYMAPDAAMPEVTKAAEKALSLDQELPLAHVWQGFYDFWYAWSWQKAEGELRYGIELDPNESFAHVNYSWYLSSQGATSMAIEEAKKTVDMEPLSGENCAWCALMYYYNRNYTESIDMVHKGLDLDAGFPFAHLILGLCEIQRGHFDEAVAALRKAHEMFNCPWSLARLGFGYARAGRKKEAMAILDTLREQSKTKYVASDIVATIYLGLGDRERAFENLEKGSNERAGWMVWLKVDPIWDPLRGDPRFAALLKKMNLDK